MATTINQYSVGLTLDAKDYIDKAKLSGLETRKLTQDIEQARSPAEKYGREHDRLTRALEAGAISEATYNRLLDSKKAKLDAANAKLTQHVDLMTKLSKVGNIVTGAYHAFQVALSALRAPIDIVRGLWGEFDTLAESIDATWKSAQKLGITFNQMSGLEFAAKEITGSADGLNAAMMQMLKRGFGGSDPLQSFMGYVDEISKMGTQAERVQRAFELFGKQGSSVLLMLQGGTEAIRDSIAFQQEWNSLTDAQALGVEKYNDTWARVALVAEGISNTFVAEIAPAMTILAEKILGIANKSEDWRDTVRDVADFLAFAGGFLSDPLNGTEAGTKAMLAAARRRVALEDEIAEKQKKAADAMVEAADAYNHTMQDAHEELFRKWNEDQDKLAETALDKAREYFEKERERDKKTRGDIVSGMHGSTIVAGSAEYFKRLADQQNSGIASMTIPDKPTPGEDAIAKKAGELLTVAVEEQKQTAEQVKLARETLVAIKENGFKRIR